MIPVASSTKVPANQVKPLLLGIGAVVALVFGISLYSLLGGGSGNDEHAVQNLPASMQTTAKAAPSDPAKPTPGATPTIEAATGYDPDGDGNENGRLAGRAHDGKSETFWKSEGYDGGNFAGKDGIGVVFSLSKEVPLRTVELEFPQEGYDVEIWLSDANDSIEKATKIGGKEGTGSKESFTVPEGTPAKRHIVVYYTKGVENDGRLYARLSEIKVT